MTSEVPIPGQDDSESDQNPAPSLEQQDRAASSIEPDQAEVATTIESRRSWSLDDIEGFVLELVDDIAIGSAGQSMQNVISARLFTYVAAWSSGIIDEVLVSAIAPTGDVGVDSDNASALSDSRVLLGRSNLPLEPLDPSKSSPIDDTYQRRLIPIRTPKRDHYDNEPLHSAVKAATRSRTHPASVTSSQLTQKSKMRKKQHGASTAQIDVTGPQPGVPYSTETHDNHIGHSSSRHHLASPRRNIGAYHAVATNNSLGPADPAHDGTPHPWDPHFHSANAATGLQLNLDTDSLRQDNSVDSRTRRSPPPLSHSPSSITSARRKPHPPGSAHSAQPAKVLRFGEREEEVKVEYAVQRSPPQRYSVSAKGVLPDISSGRITPRPSLPFPAFGAFGSANSIGGDNEKESLFDEDPLEQHFHAMPLSPGVKVRAGNESNEGPELPLFASRMRRSTFARMDTCTLPAPNPDPLSPRTSIPTNQHLVQPQRGTFITEAAWALASRSSVDGQVVARDRLVPDCWGGEKSEDLSSAEPTASCSCSSSTSLTLFRRQSKVQRPCRSCKAEPPRTEAMNFTSVIKQRAFHLKPPCLPTSSSPSKRAPGASPRRITSAPASSPLARRNLLISKKGMQNTNNRELESAATII